VRAASVVMGMAALVCGGCASGGGPEATTDAGDAPGPSDERRVARVVMSLQEAINRGDATRVCEQLLARETTGRRCIRDLNVLFRHPIYRKFRIDVRKVTIKGERATARVVLKIRGGTRAEHETYRLIRQDGEWRVALPIGGPT
jgi:hypothetical protein